MTVGERIQQRREELGLSQTQLAYRMGYSNRSAISRAETSGDESGANRVVKFAEALKCSPAYLMGWEEKTQEDRIMAYYYALSDTNKEMIVGLMRQLGENHED